MKSIVVVLSAATLLCSNLAACVEQERAAPSRPPAMPPVIASHQPLGATSMQATPGGVAHRQAESVPFADDVAGPDVNAAPAAYGVSQEDDIRMQTAQAIALASRQVDRLRRMESVSTDIRRQDIQSTLDDLENKRGRMLQDLRSLELQTPGRTADARSVLREDVDNLLDAVRSSYFVAPAPGQGLPRPSPLPPSSIH